MSYKIEIYTKKDCPYCDRAKVFLMNKSLYFKEICIDNDCSNNILFLEMCKRSQGSVTVPQIFINDCYIGGSDDLIKLGDDNGKLYRLLEKRCTL